MGGLARFEPLKDSREFSSVYKEAKKWHCDACVLFYKPSSENKLAVVASKKVGKAVVRNRAKRLLRAAFLEVCDELEDGIYIMVAKCGLIEISFDKIHKNLRWSLKKLGCLK
ncbi:MULTISPECIES: ribonuclease P protein component [Campylobacter]|uniref:Ribonuclease P protein component n=1 Tax=Campylobacter curvus (strain 525.92) TaxID=360105 RepID=A7GYZ5_CAMC5|nr:MULTISPECIES: ribonuclease P protein component [Campylobacter]EAU00280.2 ribonuclease P, protein component [Campylobacter curvus 525.92]MBN7288392.1 ribonuclease P protein component [Campylobacter curvus]MDU6827403.1 ribonuclease P protein component [Campylobacter sp.]